MNHTENPAALPPDGPAVGEPMKGAIKSTHGDLRADKPLHQLGPPSATNVKSIQNTVGQMARSLLFRRRRPRSRLHVFLDN